MSYEKSGFEKIEVKAFYNGFLFKLLKRGNCAYIEKKIDSWGRDGLETHVFRVFRA